MAVCGIVKRSPLNRNTPIKRTAFKKKRNHAKDAAWAKARQKVMSKSNGLCYAKIDGVCGGRAEHVHHIKRRSQGGTNEPNNLLICCHACHEWIHRNPEEAATKGFLDLNKGLQ